MTWDQYFSTLALGIVIGIGLSAAVAIAWSLT